VITSTGLGRSDWFAPDPSEPSWLERQRLAASSAVLVGRRTVVGRRPDGAGFRPPLAYPKVFVVGCGRSGTSWVQECLAAVPEVVSTQESHVYEQLYEPLVRAGNTPRTWARIVHRYQLDHRRQRWVGLYWWLTRDELLDVAAAAFAQRSEPVADVAQRAVTAILDAWHARCAAPGQTLLEKTPGHIAYGARILEGFPEAKIIEVVRDGRDVCVSLEKQAVSLRWPPTTREGQIRMWLRAIEHGEALQHHPAAPGRVVRVHYEDMLADPCGELARLFSAIDLTVNEEHIAGIVDEYDIGRWKNRGTGVHRRKGVAGDWKTEFSAADIQLFEELAGDTAHRIGYDASGRVRV
jgi:hypothetical protein